MNTESLKRFQELYPDAIYFTEGGIDFIHIPVLKLPGNTQPSEVEALLCPQMRDSYATRLFLSVPIIRRGANWTTHHILGKVWHSWSWQGVQADQELSQILLGHLDVFK